MSKVMSILSNTNVSLTCVSVRNGIKEKQRHQTRSHPFMTGPKTNDHVSKAAFYRFVTNVQAC